MSTLLIRAARVLNPQRDDQRVCDILIDGDTIVAVGGEISQSAADEVLDADGLVAMPGLVNGHTHAHNNLTKGLGDNWTLEDLRNNGGGLYAGRSPEDQYLAAAIGAIEMVKTGCTAAYEQFVAVPTQTHDGVDAVVQAYIDVGMRALIAPAVADIVFYHAVPGLLELLPDDLGKVVSKMAAAPVDHLLEISAAAIRKWHGSASGRISVATAPVITGECSDQLWRGCKELMLKYGAPMHTHLAETKVQAISGFQRYGRSLVHRMDDLEVLCPQLTCGHSIWVDNDDISRLAATGTKVAHNPASNLKLGSGIAPVRELLDHGISIGLGTDGSMSSDNQNMFEAMRFAALVSKVRFAHDPERWVSASEVFDMATLGSADLMGLKGQIGCIEPGKKADIVLLRRQSVFLQPLNDLTNAIVYCETGADIERVYIAGRLVVAGNRVLTVNEDAIYARAQRAVDRLMNENEKAIELSRRIQPYLRSACRVCAQTDFHINRYACDPLE